MPSQVKIHKTDPAPSEMTTAEMVNNLFASIKTLATNPATDDILQAIDAIPAMKEKIKRLEEEDRVGQKARQKLHDDYNGHRDGWLVERQHYEDRIETLRNNAQKDQETITSLKTLEAENARHNQGLQSLSAEQKEEIEGSRKKIQGLVKAIEAERERRGKLDSTVESQRDRIKQLENELDSLKHDYFKCQNAADRSARELNAAAELRVSLVEDMEALNKMDEIWRNATTLIWTFFRHDLALDNQEVKRFWLRLQQLGHWCKSVPVPASNTDAAKHMRTVVVLASLARTFTHFLFQPTDHLAPDSGLRELLLQQAAENGAIESATRAHIRALLPNQLQAARAQRVDQTCAAIMKVVEGVLPANREQEFRDQLAAVAGEASQIWEDICHCTDAVEPRFDSLRYSDWWWNALIFQNDRWDVVAQNVEQPILTVFPRLHAWYNGNSIPETHGVGLMKAQICQADQEIERTQSTPWLQRNSSARQRNDRRAPQHAGSTEATIKRRFLGGTA